MDERYQKDEEVRNGMQNFNVMLIRFRSHTSHLGKFPTSHKTITSFFILVQHSTTTMAKKGKKQQDDSRSSSSDRARTTKAETTTTTTSPRKDRSNEAKKKEIVHDPDGTLNVARGGQVVEKVELPDTSLIDPARVQEHLQGTPAAAMWSERRIRSLQADDRQPKPSTNPRHERALASRKSRTKTLTATLDRHETKRWNAAVAAASAQTLLSDQAGVLEAENDMERTSSVTQAQLVKQVDPESARNSYNLQLAGGPFGMEYDRSGRYAVLYGHQGHVALMDCHRRSLVTEFHVHERVRDACFLHNFTLFAAAQGKNVYIYDQHGAEVHCLSKHVDPMALAFLPYHWLLASIGRTGWLHYQDTSTGDLVSSHRTQLGPCRVLRQNPANAVLHAGHTNGTVTLWSPAQSRYLAKVLCHKGSAVHSLAVDGTGSTMVTGGADCQVKLWDLRMLFQPLHAYYSIGIPTSLDVSQRGILGIGHGCHATFWSAASLRTKEKEPYMHHLAPASALHTLRFRPYEDVCGLGTSQGVSSLLIPGSGEPNLDTAEYHTNPFQDSKQRREQEVRALLDKLSPNMIGLDPDQVAGVEESDPHRRLEVWQELQDEANAAHQPNKPKKTGKKRGRSKIQTQLRRRKQNVVDRQTIHLREEREREKALSGFAGGSQKEQPSPPSVKESAPDVLRRFF